MSLIMITRSHTLELFQCLGVVHAKCHPVTGYYENLYICSYEARLLAVIAPTV